MKNHPVTRRQFLTAAGAGIAGLTWWGRLALGAEKPASQRPPNIVLIVADDLGYGELGCYGGRDIPTPHLDSIAANGVRFTQGYVSCPVCSPTRAGLLTGRYQQRFGHEFNPGSADEEFGLPLTEKTLADRFKAAGYVTGMVGKWHLGNREQFTPPKRGFDEFFGFLGGAHSYLPRGSAAPDILRGNKRVEERSYLTDAFAREAGEFIKRHESEPFFLYLPFNAVHMPMQATEKYLARFKAIEAKNRRTFAAMLSAMDDAVGAVLAQLRASKLEERTLLFFLSDNGGPTEKTTSRNTPLSGSKAHVSEGGIRVPFLAQWPGVLPKGKVYDKPLISLDIAPTALAAARVKDTEEAKIDGVNLLPFLTNSEKGIPHEALYWRYGSQRAIRKGDLKLVWTGSVTPQLYDLATDVGETNNLSEGQPGKVKELTADFEKWDAQNIAPRWRPHGRGAQGRKAGKAKAKS